MKRANFSVHTSFISPWTWKTLVIEGNYLPILVIRNIKNSNVIGHLSDTSVHFKELSPSNELFRLKRNSEIDITEFQKRYLIELANVNIPSVIDRFIQLHEVSGARGIVIFGYGSNDEVCHRSVLSSLLNSTGLFRDRITELIL